MHDSVHTRDDVVGYVLDEVLGPGDGDGASHQHQAIERLSVQILGVLHLLQLGQSLADVRQQRLVLKQ